MVTYKVVCYNILSEPCSEQQVIETTKFIDDRSNFPYSQYIKVRLIFRPCSLRIPNSAPYFSGKSAVQILSIQIMLQAG